MLNLVATRRTLPRQTGRKQLADRAATLERNETELEKKEKAESEEWQKRRNKASRNIGSGENHWQARL